MPFFSIIIPCYNTKKYIKKCLDAFEQQVFKDFEVVIIDDCSTDDTLKFVTMYSQKCGYSMKILKNEKNLGPVKSREKGILNSCGRYISFCDSDDWYEASYLQSVYDTIESGHADVVICGYNTVSTSHGAERKIPHPIITDSHIKDNDISAFLVLNVDSLCVLTIKKELITSIKSPNIRNGEDMAIIPVIISSAHKCSVIQNCLYNYLYRQGSASQTYNINVVKSMIMSYEYIYNNIEKEYPEECEYIGIRNLLYGAMLNLFKFSNRKEIANKIIMDFEKKFPNWNRNQYMFKLPKYKRIFVFTIDKRLFCLSRVLARIHTTITR